jgi:hypothetical protein
MIYGAMMLKLKSGRKSKLGARYQKIDPTVP